MATDRATWDEQAQAGYLTLGAPIGAGDAAHQVEVANPVPGRGPVVLDFDATGRLLGVEVLDDDVWPPGLPVR